MSAGDPVMMEEATTGACATCSGPIELIQYTAWNGIEVDVLDEWWAHRYHPADSHDAVPA